jgi:hypothetical protein
MKEIVNLLEETLEILERFEKTPEDVEYVSDGDNATTWEEFAEAARSIEYDCSFGAHEINLNLEVVGNHWWLERYEYDGAEAWGYNERPTRPKGKGKLVIWENFGKEEVL